MAYFMLSLLSFAVQKVGLFRYVTTITQSGNQMTYAIAPDIIMILMQSDNSEIIKVRIEF